jgi:hypothetical protein
MIDHPGDTVSKFVAVSNGFMVGRARWHYPTKSWCHKEGYAYDILFWSELPSWENLVWSEPQAAPETCDGLEEAARDRFNEVHRIKPRDLWELQPEATKETYREWVKARGELKANAGRTVEDVMCPHGVNRLSKLPCGECAAQNGKSTHE